MVPAALNLELLWLGVSTGNNEALPLEQEEEDYHVQTAAACKTDFRFCLI